MSMKQSNSSHHRRTKFDLSKEEETLLNIAYDEYNDLFSQILLLKKKLFSKFVTKIYSNFFNSKKYYISYRNFK